MPALSDLPLPTSATPYSVQSQAGFRWLRFSQALESEYRAANEPTLRSRMRWAVLLGLVVWGGFALFDLWALPPLAPKTAQYPVLLQSWLARAGVGLVLLFMGACTLGRWPLTVLQALFSGAFATLAWGAAFSVYSYKNLGLPEETSVLVLVMLAIFMPLGLSVYRQIAVGLFYAGVVAILAWLAPDAAVGSAMQRMAAVLSICLVVLAFGSYWREWLHREQFLLRGDVHWIAMRDALTGLFNRRMFTHHLACCLRQAHRDGRPLALLLIDIDEFKRYNDSRGHPAGDAVLQQVAAACGQFALRPLDMAVRLGGEEFALLLYDCDAAHARHTGQAMVDAVAQLALAHPQSSVATVVTISVGCAMLQAGERPEQLYTRADQALYAAKAAGRNRVQGP